MLKADGFGQNLYWNPVLKKACNESAVCLYGAIEVWTRDWPVEPAVVVGLILNQI